MSRKSDAFIAFLSGAAVGAVLGILYAPDSGKNTREKLSFKLDKYKVKLQELIAQYTSEEKLEFTSAAKSEGAKVVKEAKTKAEALLGDVEELIGQIKGKSN